MKNHKVTIDNPNEIKSISRKKFFLDVDGWDVFCYSVEAIIDMMRYGEEDYRRVYLAQRIVGSDMIFCKKFQEIEMKEDNPCGKGCDPYSPRNGVSGACKHLGTVYERTDTDLTIQIEYK